MYLESLFLLNVPLAVVALGSLSGIAYKRWSDNRRRELENDDLEFWDYDSESCPIIMFDKSGNYYYVYE